MPETRPASPKLVAKIAGAFVTISGLITLATQWKDVRGFLFPNGTMLTWPFFVFAVLLTNLLVWFLINQRWYVEFVKHKETASKLSNLKERFNASEEERLIDVVTGVPNEAKLIRDVDSFYSERLASQEAQLVLIDINDFRSVNKRFGFLKGDELLRTIGQTLYQSMRRNEEIYKRTLDAKRLRPLWKRIYRKYPGGDEFVFLLEGGQWDAVGFVIYRLVPEFKKLSEQTRQILGETKKLAFHCAIAPLRKGDSFDDAFVKVQDCYMRAAELTGEFTVAWFPDTVERELERQKRELQKADLPADQQQKLKDVTYRLTPYEKIRQTFLVASFGKSPHEVKQ
jgi:GGDEF domain-containing protein